METITIPEGKTIGLEGARYRLNESVEVPATALGEQLKKQDTKMRPYGCPHCGFKARATRKYRATVIRQVCCGSDTAEHEPVFLVWLDDEAPEGETNE